VNSADEKAHEANSRSFAVSRVLHAANWCLKERIDGLVPDHSPKLIPACWIIAGNLVSMSTLAISQLSTTGGCGPLIQQPTKQSSPYAGLQQDGRTLPTHAFAVPETTQTKDFIGISTL
jgi:hypothetical protein